MTSSDKAERLGKEFLVEQLRRMGHTVETAKALDTPTKPWLQQIRWPNDVAASDFKEWAMKRLREEYPRKPQAYLEEAFMWWDLSHGLSIVRVPTVEVIP